MFSIPPQPAATFDAFLTKSYRLCETPSSRLLRTREPLIPKSSKALQTPIAIEDPIRRVIIYRIAHRREAYR